MKKYKVAWEAAINDFSLVIVGINSNKPPHVAAPIISMVWLLHWQNFTKQTYGKEKACLVAVRFFKFRRNAVHGNL